MKIAISGFTNQPDSLISRLRKIYTVQEEPNIDSLEQYLLNQSLFSLPDVVLIYGEGKGIFNKVSAIKKQPLLKGLIIVLITPSADAEMYRLAKEHKVSDLFVLPINEDQLIERLDFLVKFQLMRPSIEQMQKDANEITYKLPLGKRLFDIAFSGMLILCLSPILIIIAIIIRLESRGPVIYKSKRTGTGYLIFDFYKFRSMNPDADKNLSQLQSLNQYQAEGEDANSGKKAAFMKIKNDPRITRVGAFIRNTSIDEIPQLFNILKGDMSVVGNRPLPLYEAEQLTSNDWSMRFAAPAGLTGLWQIKKRGTADMSERERKKLDNFYAEKYSFLFDMRILFGTVSALLQKEKV
ncbi:MAG: sugar transferase [Bacteroidota bacterium]